MKKILPTLLLLTCFLSACASAPSESTSKSGFYFDTDVTITLYDYDADEILDECFALMEDYELIFSRTNEASELYQINHRTTSTVEISDDLATVILTGLEAYELTQGKFDITIGLLVDLWDITGDDPHVPAEEDIQEALNHTGSDKISLEGNTLTFFDDELMIDVGALAKGYVADCLKTYLEKQGVEYALINLGGNVLTIGSKPSGDAWVIGIQEPFAETGTVLTTIESKNTSIVTSGIYERNFTEDGVLYHHILDATTGYPLNNELWQVTIISSSSLEGDMLSTVTYILGLEAGLDYINSLDDVEAIFVDENMNMVVSEGLS